MTIKQIWQKIVEFFRPQPQIIYVERESKPEAQQEAPQPPPTRVFEDFPTKLPLIHVYDTLALASLHWMIPSRLGGLGVMACATGPVVAITGKEIFGEKQPDDYEFRYRLTETGEPLRVRLLPSKFPSQACVEAGFVYIMLGDEPYRATYYIGWSTSQTEHVTCGWNLAPSIEAIANQVAKFVFDSLKLEDEQIYKPDRNQNSMGRITGLQHVTANCNPAQEEMMLAPYGYQGPWNYRVENHPPGIHDYHRWSSGFYV